MSLNEVDRATLVKLEYDKALRFLKQADKNFAECEWEIAANRYYYACFHAVQALFVKNGIESHKHAGLLRLFGQHFIQTGIIDKPLGSFLNRMEQLRTKADYNVVFTVTKEELETMVEPSHTLIDSIADLLNDN